MTLLFQSAPGRVGPGDAAGGTSAWVCRVSIRARSGWTGRPARDDAPSQRRGFNPRPVGLDRATWLGSNPQRRKPCFNPRPVGLDRATFSASSPARPGEVSIRARSGWTGRPWSTPKRAAPAWFQSAPGRVGPGDDDDHHLAEQYAFQSAPGRVGPGDQPSQRLVQMPHRFQSAPGRVGPGDVHRADADFLDPVSIRARSGWTGRRLSTMSNGQTRRFQSAPGRVGPGDCASASRSAVDQCFNPRPVGLDRATMRPLVEAIIRHVSIRARSGWTGRQKAWPRWSRPGRFNPRPVGLDRATHRPRPAHPRRRFQSAPGRVGPGDNGGSMSHARRLLFQSAPGRVGPGDRRMPAGEWVRHWFQSAPGRVGPGDRWK